MEVAEYEREQIAADLRSALADTGLTQEAFARLLGTSRPRLSAYLSGRTIPSAALYQRALRTAAGLKSSRLHGWMTPDRTIDEINESLADGNEEWAFKLALQARDQLAYMLQNNDPGSDAWLRRSHEVSDPRFETLLAALVEHEFEQHNSPRIPEWTRRLTLRTPWLHPNLRRGAAWTRKHTPDWLSTRGIYISEHDLLTA
ncbi:helix-turn-helix transcriptional regulator [Kribbella qitaiheensis]|uniref:Helix-turn-helix transcriptional regulator n=1 Tax=Kribbella qitaiheensis TaxID=1544730 RepID=A0A7G6WVR0_9ACTN|nr:helix-turn-helix transcriptional regulator [Kribbella qitaiheensis]QNE18075.1 helix-turn-helix transcriptional regulator [Kribbella qitaiheensis]